MSAPPRDFAEPAPAAEAPRIIHLPYALPPAPEKKKPRRQRPVQKFARYTEDEAAELQRRATEAGLSDASFIRASTIGDPGPRSKRAMPTAQDQLTAAHHIAVKRIGVNVNQGIHALNEIALKAPEARSRDRLADEIMTTREILREMQRALDAALAIDRAALAR